MGLTDRQPATAAGAAVTSAPNVQARLLVYAEAHESQAVPNEQLLVLNAQRPRRCLL